MVATGKDYNFKKVGNNFQFAWQLMQKIKKKKSGGENSLLFPWINKILM